MSGSNYEMMRVLVLEDELHIRRIVVRLLREIGFDTIYEVSDGIDGMKELLRVNPDLIICDVHMEPMGGLKFLSTIRNLKKSDVANLPVIFLTADADIDTVMKAKELRVDGYIAKPVSLTQLKTKIDTVLAEHKARAEG
ncbi:response regulator [Nisaea acidiphila]|uniref:Response regulator n=1 Tax=Nisaea acidiphila TaxID=1862145 RepID=A0A9J7AN22_9PROT|nr:response regulator [Nisaea acidiphila]UUX48566.1 response regulator [Nisaea acidiphila]